MRVIKKAQWEAEVEQDPETFWEAIVWAVRGLVRAVEDVGAYPSGVLTIEPDRGSGEGLDIETEAGLGVAIRKYRLILDLARPRVARRQPATLWTCPVRRCSWTFLHGGNPDDYEQIAQQQYAAHWNLYHEGGLTDGF